LAVSAPARAATVAVHPLLVPGGQGDEAALYGPLLLKVLAQRGIQPAQPEAVSRFLEKHPGCEDDACLAALARAAGAERALFVSVSPYIREPLFSAQLISKSGAEVDARTVSVLKKGRRIDAVIKEGLETLMAQVKFNAPEPAAPTVTTRPPEIENPDAPTRHAAVAVPPTALANPAAPGPVSGPAARPPSGLRIASYVTVGAGVLALAGAATVALASRTDRAKLEQLSDGSGNRPPTPEALALHDSLSSRTTLTNLLLIGGGAALAAGGAMFLLSRPSTEPVVSLAAGPGGAAAFVAGHF
jgi:hypothetical protein